MECMKRVKATIVKIEGAEGARCYFGHQVGDVFLFDQYGPDKKMCMHAFEALSPAVNVLLHGGVFPWLGEGKDLYWGCPHPGSMYPGLGQVIFHVEIVKGEQG